VLFYAFSLFLRFLPRHAYDSWYYLLPALVLYLVDHARRFQHATRQVTVRSFAADPATGIVTLSYVLDGGPPSVSSRVSAGMLALRGGEPGSSRTVKSAAGLPLRCEAGQYVFLKVPALSLTESHPFSISSAPGDAWTSHHIRPMPASESPLGASLSFTAQLANLAREMEAAGKPPSSLEVSVEGPYGVSIDYLARYDAVLFIGGGKGLPRSLARSVAKDRPFCACARAHL
jgi:predicted ferric reductase